MGQYYYPVNIDKREFIHPHKFGDGLKLLEFGCSGSGTMTGLAILLCDGNGRGGGDLMYHGEGAGQYGSPVQDKHPIVGSWAGDRIVITGDYADAGKFVPPDLLGDSNATLMDVAAKDFKDVSEDVLLAMIEDHSLMHELAQSLHGFWFENAKKEMPRLYEALAPAVALVGVAKR
jgi:hypothetical protein